MSTNTLETAYANGDVIDASHINELTLSQLNDIVGRDASGVPSAGKNLGTLALPWGNVYAQGIVLNNVSLDLSQITSIANRIVSGKARSLSSQPDFITPNGAALSFILKGATTNLVLSINNVATTVSTDITKTGITAAPAANNTCTVNDATMVNDKYAGEDGGTITVDAMGTEITALIGQVVALKNGTELMLAFVKSATQLTDVYRGYFFDSAGEPLVRANLSDNSVLTLMKIGWVFVENNGTTVDVSYKTPVMSYTSPTSPVTGDYWFDYSNQVWKRYSGTSFDIINRMLVGIVASDATNTIAARSFDFYKGFSDVNDVEFEIFSTEIVRSKLNSMKCNVYGTEIQIQNSLLQWNITTNLESPLTEAATTDYYLYLSDKGQTIIGVEKPYERRDLKGYYHPYQSWRCLGIFHNNGSSNIELVSSVLFNPNKISDELIIKDVKAATTEGGTFTSGAWQTRTLNTVEGAGLFASLVSNQPKLLKGTYRVEVSATAFKVTTHKAKLRNITDSTDSIIGTTEDADSGDTSTNRSVILGQITIPATKTFEVQHQGSVTRATNGFGLASGFSVSEVYTVAKFTKIK